MDTNQIYRQADINYAGQDDFWTEFERKNERQNCWRKLFRATSDLQRLIDGLPARKAVYLEVHPYHHSQDMLCTNDCIWCTRGDERKALTSLKVPGIDPDHLILLIQKIRTEIHQGILLSGNCTEPLLYPRIDEVVHAVKITGLRLRVYSNFYYGDRFLPAVRFLDKRDYLRVSIDGFNDKAYRTTHRPRFSDAFAKTVRNLEAICSERDSAGHHFQIGLTWLLTRSNSNLKDIRNAVQWGEAHRIQSIRFRVPVTPLIGKEDFCAADSLLVNEELHALGMEVQTLQRRFREIKLQLVEEPSIQPTKPFSNCHYFRIMSVLGATGRFFPCTSVSLATAMSELGCGDVNEDGFDYSKARHAFAGQWSKLDPKRCCGGDASECTRFEYLVNDWLHRLRKSDSQAGFIGAIP